MNKMSIEEFAKVLKDNGFEVEFRNTTDMTRRGGAKRYLDFSKKYVNGDIIDGTAVEQFSKNLGNDWQANIRSRRHCHIRAHHGVVGVVPPGGDHG